MAPPPVTCVRSSRSSSAESWEAVSIWLLAVIVILLCFRPGRSSLRFIGVRTMPWFAISRCSLGNRAYVICRTRAASLVRHREDFQCRKKFSPAVDGQRRGRGSQEQRIRLCGFLLEEFADLFCDI